MLTLEIELSGTFPFGRNKFLGVSSVLNCTFFTVQHLLRGPQAFELRLKVRLVWLGGETCWRKEVILKGGQIDTQGRWPSADKGRDWSYAEQRWPAISRS